MNCTFLHTHTYHISLPENLSYLKKQNKFSLTKVLLPGIVIMMISIILSDISDIFNIHVVISRFYALLKLLMNIYIRTKCLVPRKTETDRLTYTQKRPCTK